MALHTHISLRTAMFSALFVTAACSSGPSSDSASAASAWSDTTVNVVSRFATGSGVTAVTVLRGDGHLETAVYDLARSKRLWARPATMAGRLSGMGVQPPAVVGSMVAALEPQTQGPWNALLVVRDARTGVQKWTRPVDSTFGPVRCGPYLCLSEFTARTNARVVVLDAANGHTLWRMPGIAEVEWSDATRAVFFRMAKHPVLESLDLKTGRSLWTYAVENAVGTGVNLSGGWSFGSLGDVLVGYLAPYQAHKGKPLSTFGFFGLRLSDGVRLWTRPQLLRVYPSANPAVALITREITPSGGYGGFAQLDPRTGQATAQLPADKAPQTAWWLAFPADLSALGFLSSGHPSTAYDLRRATPVSLKRAWSFCTVDPAPLPIKGLPGFYPIASLCAYDLSTGRRVATPGPPPGWYTGATDGWRAWRDESGALHAVHDARGTTPGMYS